METPNIAQTPARSGPSSAQITAAIGSTVVIVGLVFAFDAGYFASHWYMLFKWIHVTLAVFWVGGGLLLTTIALRAERSQEPEEMAYIARTAAFVGERLFAPAGLLVFLMGIAMMINTDWGWGKFWVVVGLLGYAVTFATGLLVLGPMAKRVAVLLDTKGAAAPETQAAIQRILLLARVDIGVLLLVVADMVTKPFS